MAVFSGINNTSVFNPGFQFSDFLSSIQSAENTLSNLVITTPSYSGQNPDGSYYGHWNATNTDLWFRGSLNANTGIATLKEFELNIGSGVDVGFSGSATINVNTGQIGSVNAKEVWIDAGDGYSIDYVGSLNFNIHSGAVSGALKTLYMGHENGSAAGDMDYVKLAGSVTVDGNGNFSGGTVTSIEWGNLTIGASEPTFSIAGKVSGLKIDATTIESALEAHDFSGLMSLAYSGNDTITGTSGNDFINASTGNDKVDGSAGNDLLIGGNGNDIISGGAGNDQIWGDTDDAALNATFTVSNDKITDTQGNNLVFAGNGSNVVTVGDGNDWVQSGNGKDTIIVGGGDNLSTLFSLAADQIGINPGSTAGDDGYTDDYFSDLLFNNIVLAGLGNNVITAGSGNDYIKTDDEYVAGWDELNATYTYVKSSNSSTVDGNNKIVAGDGHNVILVGDGNNTITCGNGPANSEEWMNQVFAGNGNNKIATGSGDDLVFSGNGNNSVTVGDGHNEVYLGTGNNKVIAGNGGNEIWTGTADAFDTYLNSNGATKGNGNQTITTGNGDDLVSSWEGNDVAKVGAGADQVDLGSGNNKIDLGVDTAADQVTFGWDLLAAALDNNTSTLAFNTVTNFNTNDSMWFNLEDLGALTLDQIDVSAHASITTGGHNLVLDSSTGKLYYDVDGTGTGAAAIQIGLISGSGLHAGFDISIGTSDVTITSVA